jgi:hypothetical protein
MVLDCLTILLAFACTLHRIIPNLKQMTRYNSSSCFALQIERIGYTLRAHLEVNQKASVAVASLVFIALHDTDYEQAVQTVPRT